MVLFNSSLNLFVLLLLFCVPEYSIGSDSAFSTKDKPKLDKTKLKILTQYPNDGSKTKENDASQYELKDESDLLEYKFKDGTKCVGVNYDGKEVWKYDESNGNGHPLALFFNVNRKTILLVLKEAITILKLQRDQWRSTFSGKPETVNLNTKSKKDEDNWSYCKNDKIGTYTAKSGKFFNAVTHNTVEVWKTENKDEHATKVVVNGIGKKEKTVSIHFVNGLVKKCSRSGKDKPWVEVGTTNEVINDSLQPLTFIIHDKKSTPYYEYDCQDKKHTYTANEGYCFKTVQFDNPAYASPILTVWSTDKPEEYVIKIEWESSLKENVFILYLDNGETKKILKNYTT